MRHKGSLFVISTKCNKTVAFASTLKRDVLHNFYSIYHEARLNFVNRYLDGDLD
jgi:uncharacterized protein YpiB (UPF0302 family)